MRASRAVAGLTLPEVLVALLLGLFIVQLGLGTLARLDGARRRLAARTDFLVTKRVTRHVLRTELGHGVAGTDWQVGGDSVSLRAFRGTALVCRADSATASLSVSFRGERAPDPTKDSVLLLTEAGRREVRALAGVGAPASPCTALDSAGAATWNLDAPAPDGTVLARLFERGSYHLDAYALRYRRGASGRQPLTPESLSPASRWIPGPDHLGVVLLPEDSVAGSGWTDVVAWDEGS